MTVRFPTTYVIASTILAKTLSNIGLNIRLNLPLPSHFFCHGSLCAEYLPICHDNKGRKQYFA